METDIRESKRTYNVARGQYPLALELLQHANLGSSARILDVGAGMGEFSALLAEQGFSMACIDGTKRCYEHLVREGFESYQLDLEEESLPFAEGSFDAVVSLEVIEHLWNTDHYLREIWRVLKPGGYFVCTTPNYNNWRYRLNALLGRVERFTYKSRHKKFFTARSFPRQFQPYFRAEELLGFGWLPRVKKHFINKRAMNLLSMQVGVLCRKTNEKTV